MGSIHERPAAGKDNPIVYLEIELADGVRRSFRGREAWALNELLEAGDAGITSIQYAGVRLADTVFKLRGVGLDIETETVTHTGPFRGHHGKYRLHNSLRVLRVERHSKGGVQ